MRFFFFFRHAMPSDIWDVFPLFYDLLLAFALGLASGPPCFEHVPVSVILRARTKRRQH